MLAIEIENTLHVMQTCLKNKEYPMKYMGCHHKEAVWKKLVHLDHFPKMVNKFEQEQGHELGVRKNWKKKKDPLVRGLNIDEDTNF